MEFSYLPDTAFLKIFEYLPLEDCIRTSRVDKTFRRFAQLAVSRTKSLDLTEDRFENLNDDQLAVILDLCSPKLERIKFPSRDSMEEPTGRTDWKARDRREKLLDKQGRKLARVFAFYHCPRLIDINLGHAAIDYAAFNRLIRNNPNLESLIWREKLVVFPNVTNNNLKKLTLDCSNNDSVQSIIGRCPNLEELELTIKKTVPAKVLDQVFASIPQAHRVDLNMNEYYDMVDDMRLEKELAHLWNLPLTSLSINFPEDILYVDNILYKVASSFPHLQTFRIGRIMATRNGISALAVLQDLEILDLPIDFEEQEDDYQDGLRQLTSCKKLRKLDMETLSIRAGILITLLRGCPQLYHIKTWEIVEVDNPNKAVELLEGLLGISNRDITIQFQVRDKASLKSIWEAESVKEMIKTLKENYGLKIRLVFTEMLNAWQQQEDSSDFSSDSSGSDFSD